MTLCSTVKRKSEVRIFEKLPNGLYLNLYFFRKRPKTRFAQWHVALYISKTRKEANKWFNNSSKRKKNPITGDGSLIGLKRALDYILEFSRLIGFYEELIVNWEDERRRSAYRYLKRHGFIDYCDKEGNITGYGIRNPNFYEWIPKEEVSR
ncbi:hypothetical protein P4S83_17780 [Aneurinibacillus thermoaerophilus]|uniref:hypothetical protein n=1 Tax=Aneurinibacillus thermoaerophilus TaxID=143495 RepID=UPI002E1D8689|nr:hypothetical protein [Aneurinibacillus thermoaerophilus]MED0765529.1 hypothetical protein [Aneurinibacillus thermoaerophilus]